MTGPETDNASETRMPRRLPVLVLATRNPGKTAEIRSLLSRFPVDIRNLSDFGPIPEVEEDGTTFEENAYKKASFTARVLGAPALSDDSGLCVPLLGGAPGVLSARYGGPGATDPERCRLLIDEMRGRGDRRAAFECVLSLAVPSGPALTYEGRCEGVLADAPAGENGFGYDPIFFFPPSGRTFAQLSREEKMRVSHRGKALAELSAEFEKVMIWIRRHMPPSDPWGQPA
jgi:XTP/dITP diphosphohydrolase